MAHLTFYGLSRICADELEARDHDVELPIIRAAALRTELEKDDPSDAPHLLEALADALAAVRAPVRIVHALYWELCFVFRREFAKRGCCEGAPDALSEREPETLNDFAAFFSGRCAALIAAKTAARSHFEKSQNRADRIRSRIERACVAPDFTLHPILEEERLTASALSNLFKNAYGETITDFVGRTRIDKAKELLAAGSSVKEVVARVGYQDATSFIRKFKGSTGLTPKEWADARIS
jgi:AraC-like DNA-binding protein